MKAMGLWVRRTFRSRALHSARALTLAGLVTMPGGAQAAAESQDIKNIVIEGTPRIEMKGDKPPYVPLLNPLKPLGDFLARELTMSNPVDKLSLDLKPPLPTPIGSDVVLSPWRRSLSVPPVLDLSVEFAAHLKVSHWRFIITDDQGKVFRVIKGSRRLPERIVWNGMGKDGTPLRVGHPYAYSLSILDQSGVPTYLSGKTVKLGSFVYEASGDVKIAMDTPGLFGAGHELSPQGRTLLREVQDALRDSADRSLSVTVHGNDSDLAQRQAEMIAKHLEHALHLGEGRVAARGLASAREDYLRTEVWAR